MARRKSRRRAASFNGKWALVVEPGRVRAGAWTAGVFAALTEMGITIASFNFAIGVSSGAACLLYYVTKQLRRGLVIWRRHLGGSKLVRWWNPILLRPFLDLHYLFEHVFTKAAPLNHKRVVRATTKFEIVVTNIRTGCAEYVNVTPENCLRVAKASAALRPFFWGPVRWNGGSYLDGGFSDILPIQHAIDHGYKNILAITVEPIGTRATPHSRLLARILFPFSRNMRHAFLTSHERYNRAMETIEHPPEGVTIVAIRPQQELGLNGFETRQEKIDETMAEAKREALRIITGERLRSRLPNVKKIRNGKRR